MDRNVFMLFLMLISAIVYLRQIDSKFVQKRQAPADDEQQEALSLGDEEPKVENVNQPPTEGGSLQQCLGQFTPMDCTNRMACCQRFNSTSCTC